MSSLKTIVAVCSLSVSATQSPALPSSDDAQLQFFAVCAGRLSATMEHQSLFDGSATENTMAQHRSVVEMIDAILPEGRGKDVRNWQLRAKVAHSGLLTRATFSTDQRISREAKRLAGLYLAECTEVLLG